MSGKQPTLLKQTSFIQVGCLMTNQRKIMSCECHQIGGRFIAEDPDCPVHGREADLRASERHEITAQLNDVLALSDELDEWERDVIRRAVNYLQSL